jgi:hypothetical protein
MKTEALLSLEPSELLAPAQRHGVISHLQTRCLRYSIRSAEDTLPTLNKIYSIFLLHVHTCSSVQLNYKKTATGALRDAVPRLCQGVIYFQNVIFLLHVHTCSSVQLNYTKTATGALCDAVPRLCQGILCFQNVMRLHGTCVLIFASIRNVRSSLRRTSLSFTCSPLAQNVSHIG